MKASCSVPGSAMVSLLSCTLLKELRLCESQARRIGLSSEIPMFGDGLDGMVAGRFYICCDGEEQHRAGADRGPVLRVDWRGLQMFKTWRFHGRNQRTAFRVPRGAIVDDDGRAWISSYASGQGDQGGCTY